MGNSSISNLVFRTFQQIMLKQLINTQKLAQSNL
jgi:hypothetical protein